MQDERMRDEPNHDVLKEVQQLEPMAKRFAKEIGKAANTKWRNGAQMAAAVAARTLQNIVVSVVLSGHEPGSTEGQALLERFYAGVLKDTLSYWNSGDFLQRYFKIKKG